MKTLRRKRKSYQMIPERRRGLVLAVFADAPRGASGFCSARTSHGLANFQVVNPRSPSPYFYVLVYFTALKEYIFAGTNELITRNSDVFHKCQLVGFPTNHNLYTVGASKAVALNSRNDGGCVPFRGFYWRAIRIIGPECDKIKISEKFWKAI